MAKGLPELVIGPALTAEQARLFSPEVRTLIAVMQRALPAGERTAAPLAADAATSSIRSGSWTVPAPPREQAACRYGGGARRRGLRQRRDLEGAIDLALPIGNGLNIAADVEPEIGVGSTTII